MIHGIEIKDFQTNADERGSLTDTWRSNWEFFQGANDPAMSYLPVSYQVSSARGTGILAAILTTSSYPLAR